MEKRHNYTHQPTGIFRWLLTSRDRRPQMTVQSSNFDESARYNYYNRFQDSQANLHLAAH